jgi:hypothetical protein
MNFDTNSMEKILNIENEGSEEEKELREKERKDRRT